MTTSSVVLPGTVAASATAVKSVSVVFSSGRRWKGAVPVATHRILVLNSGAHPLHSGIFSNSGVTSLVFMEIHILTDTMKLQGRIFDDVVWVRSLYWDHPDRHEIESRVNMRITRRDDGT